MPENANKSPAVESLKQERTRQRERTAKGELDKGSEIRSRLLTECR